MTEKELLQETNEAIKAIREVSEKKDKTNQDIIKNATDKLNKLEDFNQELVKVQAEKDKKYEELQENIKSIETKFSRFPSGTDGSEKSAAMKAFDKYIRIKSTEFAMDSESIKALRLDGRKYLRTDIDPQGGYLAPNEFLIELLKNITEISNIRQVATVKQTTRGAIEIPRRINLVGADWVGEGAIVPESQSSYGLETINLRKIGAQSIITHEMLNDAVFNMDQEITSDITERFAQTEGLAFVQGAGVNRPEGFLVNPDIGIVETIAGGELTADSLIEITGELKTGYNPVYLLNRRTLATIRAFKGGDGHFLWQPGLAAGLPNQINGHPYVEVIDMDNIAANAFPVAFGDFKRGYTIVDGMSMLVIRDDVTQAGQGKVVFTFLKMVGGKVTLPEAILKIKIIA